MHIIKLTIHNFKSYKQTTTFGPFSPNRNIVVGRNGSGKSNFFAAIRFVLNDHFSRMGQEERQGLINETSANGSAWVEIEFDNGEGRLPTGKPICTIRRTIGLKKDEYMIDGKPCSRTDLQSLLTSAGLSKSNPYYIIPQGRITALCNATPAARLQLLKTVAGVQVFEDHLLESSKILSETALKRERIQELLGWVGERMQELEKESVELREWQAREGEIKGIEYRLLYRELASIQLEIDQLDDSMNYAEDAETGNDQSEGDAPLSPNQILNSLDLESSIEQLTFEMRENQLLMEQEQSEAKQLQLEHAQLTATLQSTAAAAYSSSASVSPPPSAEDLGKEIELISIQKNKLENQINLKQKEFQECAQKLSALQQLQSQRQIKLDALTAAIHRSSQFSSARQRDKWIDQQCALLKGTLTSYQNQRTSIQEECDLVAQQITDTQGQLHAHQQEQIEHKKSKSERAQRAQQATQQKRELWRAEARIKGSLETLQQALSTTNSQLFSQMPPAILAAHTCLPEICQDLGIDGTGNSLPFYQTFNCDRVFWRAVSEVGGGALWDWVVPSGVDADAIIGELQSRRAGRCTFMPLDALAANQSSMNHAENSTVQMEGATLLTTHLQYNPEHKPAIMQVFGGIWICRDLQTATALNARHYVTCVTLEGERVDKRGAISYNGSSGSRKGNRMALISQSRQCQEKIKEHQELLTDITDKLEMLRKSAGSAGFGGEEFDHRLLQSQIESLQSALQNLHDKEKTSKEALEKTIQQIGLLETKIAALSAERGTLLGGDENANSEIASLRESIRRDQAAVNELQIMSREVQTQMEMLTEDLDGREGEERRKQCSLEAALEQEALQQSLQEQLARIQERCDQIAQDCTELSNLIAQQTEKIDKLHLQQKEQQARQQSINDTKNTIEYQKAMAKKRSLLHQKSSLLQKQKELTLSIPDDPSEATESLLAKLSSLHSRHQPAIVNKHAIEQLNHHSHQATLLNERSSKMADSEQAIKEFITILEGRRSDAVERTWMGVSEAFSKTFRALEPNGQAELVLLRRSLEGEGEGEDGGDGRLASSLEESTKSKAAALQPPASALGDVAGIEIHATFSLNTKKSLPSHQLSGGQKSILSLCLIFAIQSCDPSPFHLLDEIDAALDREYRGRLAVMLASMPGQFILTTFRAEMLNCADGDKASRASSDNDDDRDGDDENSMDGRDDAADATHVKGNVTLFWGVGYSAGESSVQRISRQQALQFVEHEPELRV